MTFTIQCNYSHFYPRCIRDFEQYTEHPNYDKLYVRIAATKLQKNKYA